MKLIIMGNRVGDDTTERIGTISVGSDGVITAESGDRQVASGLDSLIRRQLKAGGFVCQVSRFEPNEFRPEYHAVYAISQSPTDPHFDWALESTVSVFWTGKRVGKYEINGFKSFLER